MKRRNAVFTRYDSVSLKTFMLSLLANWLKGLVGTTKAIILTKIVGDLTPTFVRSSDCFR